MSNRFSQLISILGLSTLSLIGATQVNAQETFEGITELNPVTIDVIKPSPLINFNELMEQAFFENSGDFADQASISGQLDFIFGWRTFPEGSYVENSIVRDSFLMRTILDDYYKQLTQRDPMIRTRDIPNPFETSIRQDPSLVNP